MVSEFLRYYSEIEVNYKTLLKNKLSSLMAEQEESFHIRNDEELISLKDLIIAHKLKLSSENLL